jgi:hypothetical protein
MSLDPIGTLKVDYWDEPTTGPYVQQIQQAEKRIRDELQKALSCRKDGKGSCIPPVVAENLNNLKYTLQDHLNLGFVAVDPTYEECGHAPQSGWKVTLSSLAFTKACDCLASTLYHELLHNYGLDDQPTVTLPSTYDLEGRCMSALCKKGP